MAEYDFVFETPYNIPKGTAYPCTIDRPKDQRKPVRLSVASFYVCELTNTIQFTLQHIQTIPMRRVTNYIYATLNYILLRRCTS